MPFRLSGASSGGRGAPAFALIAGVASSQVARQPGETPGYGMGRGMMGGYGPGMMGLRQLDLNDDQRTQVNRIQDELRRKNWDILGKTQDEAARLRDLYAAEKFDRAAVSAAYKRLGELRQARIENTLEAHEKLESVLTPEQRKTLRRWQADASFE